MTDQPAPRRIERALEAFGADTELCDAVIGDLAEEFAIRAEMDGEAVARRWYWRESVRVAPYLLRDWWRGLGPKDVWYFTKVVAASSFTVAVFGRVVGFTLYGFDPGLMGTWETLANFGAARPLVFVALMLGWTFLEGMSGGWLATRLGRRAPLSSAVALGAASLVMALPGMLQPASLAVLVEILTIATLLSGIAAGGVLGAMRADPRAEALSSGTTAPPASR